MNNKRNILYHIYIYMIYRIYTEFISFTLNMLPQLLKYTQGKLYYKCY